MQDNRGIQYSAILHGVFFALIIFGLPKFMQPEIIPEPSAISVDILPTSLLSNVPTQEKIEKPEPKKPVEEVKKEVKAAPEAKKEEVKKPDAVPLPEPKKPEEKKPEEKKPEPKKEEIKPDVKKPEPKKPEPKKKEDDLDSILKSVKDQAKAVESKKPTAQAASQNQSKSDRYDDRSPISMSDKDKIKQQIEINWNIPAGVKDAQNLVVELLVTVSEDGTVTSVKHIGSTSRYSSEPNFRAAVDSAMRAVQRSSPLKDLPAGKYAAWREMELVFNPGDVLN